MIYDPLTKAERQQCIKFNDAIGEIVDAYLKEGMPPDRVKEILEYEARYVHGRLMYLEADRG